MGLFKSYSEREVKKVMPIVKKINDLEEEMAKMPLDSDEKAGSKEESSNKEASLNDELQEKPMIFTQESLFDLF